MTQLLDFRARHSVEHDLDVNLFVEAGAGTGKTTTLVRRVVQLFATGRLAEPRRLAAITFTESAAAELRDRIRSGLEEAARTADDPASRQRCRDAAGRIDEATITTLHGFAQRILAEHPLAAGLPPAFDIDVGIPAELELVERWRRFVGELLADPELDTTLRLGFALRLSLDRLLDVAQRMLDRWDRLADHPAPSSSGTVPEVRLAAVAEPLRQALAVLGERRATMPDDGLVRVLVREVEPVLALYDGAIATGDPLEMARVLDTVASSRGANRGQKPRWGDDKAVVTELLAAAADERDTQLVAMRTAVMESLLPHVARFTAEWAEERRRTGRLHFHDLLVLARRLLWTDREVRTSLAERWQVLLVDEFQDTDPLQVELVFALAAADPSSLPASWEEIELGPGRVLVVGDPKQSIYGFRGADITLWNRARERFGAGVVELTQNFRSLDSILRWINTLFEELIGAGEGDLQPAYIPLQPQRVSLEAASDVVVLGGPHEGLRAAEVRVLEAAEIAAVITAMRKGSGPVRHQDIAILVPTRTPIGQLERSLDGADIPYRIESRSLVWGTDAIRDVLNVLSAVEDPADEVAVVAALRSPAFACTDLDLVTWRAAGGRWDHTRRLDGVEVEAGHPVLAAMSTLRAWHHARHWLPVDAMVEQVIAERRMIELTMAQRRPRDHWRRLRFIVDQARAFVEAGGATLDEFLRWTELQVAGRADAVETVVPEADDDAVRILTVHGAKGLEFPVVVLAGLSAGSVDAYNDLRWTDGPTGYEATIAAEGGGAAFATTGWGDAKGRAKLAEDTEALRLLYVATTRARDRLVVSLHHGANMKCHASRIVGAGDLGPRWAPAEGAAAEPLPLDLAAAAGGAEARSAAERAEWRRSWSAAMEAARRGWSVSPTGLARLVAPSDDLHDNDLDDLDDAADIDDDSADPGPASGAAVDERHPAPPSAPRGGSAVGRAVHGVLESVPLDGAGPVDVEVVAALAARFAAAEEVEAATVAELAGSALASHALAEARAAGRLWREVPVVVPIADRLLEGFIDLLYERPDGGIVVVDWKTDRARTEAEVDASLARYRLQGAGYAAALRVATGRPVAEVRFVFCRGGGQPAVERSITDLDAAVAEVEALLA